MSLTSILPSKTKIREVINLIKRSQNVIARPIWKRAVVFRRLWAGGRLPSGGEKRQNDVGKDR